MSYGYYGGRSNYDRRKARTQGWGTPLPQNKVDPHFQYRDSDQATHVRKRVFPNIGRFADYCESQETTRSYSANKGITLLRNGDPDMVADAQKIMGKLTAHLPTISQQWEMAIAGAFPSVPDYLANSPENMWYRRYNPDDTAPVTIYVNVLPSGGCSDSQLLTRGAVIVALVQLLMKRRNQVKVIAYADQPCDQYYDRTTKTYVQPGVVICYQLPTSPVILSKLCTSLGHPYVVRNVMMHAAEITDPHINGGWLRGHEPTYGYNEAKVRVDLGAAPQDVILPALHYEDPCINDPVGFIHRELKRILGDFEDNNPN